MNYEAANSNLPTPDGKLAENIMHFGRVLREAGLPAGPGAVLDALTAAQCGAIRSRDDFYWTLHCVFVKRREHKILFDQAFHVFWRKPKMLDQVMQLLFQQTQVFTPPSKPRAGQRRLANAFFHDAPMQSKRQQPPGEIELEGEMTSSAREVLRKKDFEQMSIAEQADAKAAIARMRLTRFQAPQRRFSRSKRGERIDMRATLRRSLSASGEMVDLAWRRRTRREPPLVILCDISGSMENYSRIFLHFIHALTSDRDRVQVFLFGTRLTNVTREVARRDVDEALERVSEAVKDWSGGTRIGASLREFNYKWARRVLSQGAHVVVMTDGLDREDTSELEHEMERLHRAAKRVIWLNPLLRYEGFEARAAGVRCMMPHVDEFRPVHNLTCLEDLALALTHNKRSGRHDPRKWLKAGEMEMVQ